MNLGKAHWSMAWAQYRLGRHADALVSLDQALAIFDRLIKAEPNNLDYQIEAARALSLKGVIYDDQRQNRAGSGGVQGKCQALSVDS